jgi:hypothetical protein
MRSSSIGALSRPGGRWASAEATIERVRAGPLPHPGQLSESGSSARVSAGPRGRGGARPLHRIARGGAPRRPRPPRSEGWRVGSIRPRSGRRSLQLPTRGSVSYRDDVGRIARPRTCGDAASSSNQTRLACPTPLRTREATKPHVAAPLQFLSRVHLRFEEDRRCDPLLTSLCTSTGCSKSGAIP